MGFFRVSSFVNSIKGISILKNDMGYSTRRKILPNNRFSPLYSQNFYYSTNPRHAEVEITNKLKDALQPSFVSVKDISGGCGSMYRIEILSDRFKGLSKVQQQRLVNQVLKEEIQQWHGLQLLTEVPEESSSE